MRYHQSKEGACFDWFAEQAEDFAFMEKFGFFLRHESDTVRNKPFFMRDVTGKMFSVGKGPADNAP